MNKTKVLALYLPQYYDTNYNNDWWGNNYTEWVACKQAKPLFKGHKQPKLPMDNHFYDLSNKNEILWQTELARKYGIDGFVIYQYYSCNNSKYGKKNGKLGSMLLNVPTEIIRDNDDIDTKYCLYWANHDWRKAWFGQDETMLWPQLYGDVTDWKEFYEYNRKYFLDERYIKIDNKPIYIIFADWHFKEIDSFIDCWNKWAIPTIFLGLGAGDSIDFAKSDAIVDRVLTMAKVIMTRDKQTEKMLKKYGAMYMPCPALFAAPSNKIVKEVKKIGLIYATHETLKGNNVSKSMHDYIIDLYKELNKIYDVELVCHYIDEIDKAKDEFPDIDINYSYDSKDYIDIYNKFDLVIGGRVHGIGMSASLGIPGIMIKHDSRSSTTDGFLATSINIGTSVNDIVEIIEAKSKNIENESKKLNEHKKETMSKYLEILKERLHD